MTTLDPAVAAALAEFRAAVAAVYGERFVGLYLFGSHARGEATSDSDMDVLAVLSRIEGSVGQETMALAALAYPVVERSGVEVNAVAVEAADWAFPDRSHGLRTLLQSARRDAVAVHAP